MNGNPYHRLYLDVDGVLADFSSRIISNYNLKHGTTYTHDDVTDWTFSNILQPGQQWGDYVDPDFWTSLDTYPWAYKLLGVAQNAGIPYAFLTSLPDHNGPSGGLGAAIEGRKRWLDAKFTHLGELTPSRRLVVADRKELVVGPHDILVEDAPKNIHAVREAGGHVMALAQPWNTEVWNRMSPEAIILTIGGLHA